MFETKVEIDGVQHPLVFKEYRLIPSKISRLYMYNSEAQTWAALEWGLVSPTAWPIPAPEPADPEATETAPVATTPAKESTAIGDGMLNEVPMRRVMDIYREWQKHSRVLEGESNASSG
jgi:hypothetical protein